MKKNNPLFNKSFIVNELLIKEALNQKLNLNEFLLLMAFAENDGGKLDIEKITEHLYLKEEDALEALNSLVQKKLINNVSKKDENGKLSDYIEMDGIFDLIEEGYSNSKTASKKNDIYSRFEKEFGRTITPMEYEIINGWIEAGFKENVILRALKEAIYNGVTNVRYIDKILFEWKKQGLNTEKDIEDHLNKRKKKDSSPKELFDCDWINIDDEGK